ncbi:glycosyl transferase [Microbacterium sp. NPDC089695]|uniref:glycosyl transferase n=1 Tax=Microbacterium sp. NPDC089695 TaxID=3364198 RepID=UPI0038006331
MSTTQPHLLYVAWGYPPSRGSGVYRAWATANAFARAGWKVTVLTVPREVFEMSTGVDLTLEAQVDPSIRIVRVPFTSGAFANDLSDWSWLRAHAPEIWNTIQAWRGRRAFPERNYGGWRPILEEAARRIHREDPVDLTIGTANPNVDFIPGYVLSTEFGVPAVMDHRDAWAVDIYSGRRVIDPASRAGRWERRLVENAEEVWFVNRPIRDWYAQQYPDHAERFLVVENGYDQALTFAPRQREPEDVLVFGYIGTISGAVPMEELVAGWALARERSPLVRRARMDLYGYLDHFGVPGKNMVRAMDQFAANDIRYLGPVGRGEIASTYATFDALVLTFGAGRFITGGKVYEYASTGLPIVSVHDPANETSRTLAPYPGWHGAAAMTTEAIADAFIATAEYALSQTPSQRADARRQAEQYSRNAQLEPRIRSWTERRGSHTQGESTK